MVHGFMEVKLSFQCAPVGGTLGLRWGSSKRCCFIHDDTYQVEEQHNGRSTFMINSYNEDLQLDFMVEFLVTCVLQKH